jgi:hypothetical protein
VREGILRVDRGQQILGLEVDTSRAIYLKQEQSAAPTAPDEPTPGASPDPEEENTDDTSTDDATAKMLRGIARRRGFVVAANGNGKH